MPNFCFIKVLFCFKSGSKNEGLFTRNPKIFYLYFSDLFWCPKFLSNQRKTEKEKKQKQRED
jgi:hypothetical protein